MIPDDLLFQRAQGIWAAIVERAILDYRRAVFEKDEPEMNTIEKQMSVMGYGDYMEQIKWNAMRFQRVVDSEIRRDPKKRRRYIDCPACHAEGKLEIIRRTSSLCAICYSCGCRYHFPLWRLKKEEQE